MSLTEKIAEFVVETQYKDMPKDAIIVAKLSLLDTLGVTLAGSTQPIAKIIKNYLEDFGNVKQCTVIGLGMKTPCSMAAFANGTLAHTLDYDDNVLDGIVAHPSPPVVPSALAVGESINASGEEVLTAYMIGVEVECKIGYAIHPSHYQKGWHSTGTLGAFGAMAAAGKLLELSQEQILHAIGITASESAGIRGNFGTMTKPFHAGRAAENGVVAAMLAKRGFTANKDILEAEAGYFSVMSGDGYDPKEVKRSWELLGNPWGFIDPGITYKLYPCCLSTHAALNALLPLVKEHEITPGYVESVEVGECRVSWDCLPYHEPKNWIEMKFSMEFSIAAALLEREVGLQSFTDEKVQDPRIVKLMKKVKPYVDEELSASIPYGEGDSIARVKIKLKDGRTWNIVGKLEWTPDQLIEKYKKCTKIVIPEEKAAKLMSLIQKIEEVDSIKTLMQLMY